MFKKTQHDSTTKNSTSGHKKFSFRRNQKTTTATDPQSTSTKSDWDHYAVRHEDTLIGDPVPIVEPGRAAPFNNNLATNATTGNGNNGLIIGSDPANAQKQGLVNNYGTVAPGPVVSTSAIKGNYSTGTVVETVATVYGQNGTQSGYTNAPGYIGTASTQPLYGNEVRNDNLGSGNRWNEPLYGPSTGSGWSAPLHQNRDVRDTKTPLLPDNPWTHNELGREYVDAYKSGTLPNKSIDAPKTVVETVTTTTRRDPIAPIVAPSHSVPVQQHQQQQYVAPVLVAPVVAVAPVQMQSVTPIQSMETQQWNAIPVPPPNPPVYQIPRSSRLSSQMDSGYSIPIQSTDNRQNVGVTPLSATKYTTVEETMTTQQGYNAQKVAPMSWYNGNVTQTNPL